MDEVGDLLFDDDEANVADVDAINAADKADDIAGLELLFGCGKRGDGDVPLGPRVVFGFLFLQLGKEGWVRFKGGVSAGVGGHIADFSSERHGSEELGAEIRDGAFSGVIEEPVGGVMEPGEVAIDVAAPVAGLGYRRFELRFRGVRSSSECEDGLHEGDAIKATEEDSALFLGGVLVEGRADVGGVNELPSKELHSFAEWLFVDVCFACFSRQLGKRNRYWFGQEENQE